MYLNSIETGMLGIAGTTAELLDNSRDLLTGKCTWLKYLDQA